MVLYIYSVFGFFSKKSSVSVKDFDLCHGVDEFTSRHFDPRLPAIIRSGASNWPLFEKWDKNYIINQFGSYQCKIVRDSRPAFSRETQSLKDYFERFQGKSTLTLEKYAPAKQKLFLKDIELPNQLFKKSDIHRFFFFHSVKDAGTLPHVHRDAFNILQSGVKHWIFYDAHERDAPKGFRELQQCRLQYGPGNHMKDWYNKEFSQLPKRVEKVYTCTQNAGDIVYIPHQFSHAVLNKSEVMGLVVEVNSRK